MEHIFAGYRRFVTGPPVPSWLPAGDIYTSSASTYCGSEIICKKLNHFILSMVNGDMYVLHVCV